MDLLVTTAAQRPDLVPPLEDFNDWPAFMRQDPVSASSCPVEVPGALVPVHCDIAHDRAVYCEPCVWVHHRPA